MRISDWSSDVCSSELRLRHLAGMAGGCDRPQEDLRQHLPEWPHPGPPLFPARQRLHPGVRADAHREPGPRLVVPAVDRMTFVSVKRVSVLLDLVVRLIF